jgi:dolichyl-diphosphooligosaccharide--protein glycosyltransferase
MVTSAVIYNVLHLFNIPVNIRDVCVMLAPAFSGLTAYATYLLGKELGKDNEGKGGDATGLWAALFIGIAPGYISRSVAGSYDNEAIAIFILMFTFYLWIKALKEGSALYGGLTALFYFYMVAAWGESWHFHYQYNQRRKQPTEPLLFCLLGKLHIGGYAFITNMLPLHAFALICMGRFSPRLYVAYTTYYAIGTLASFQVPFVGFQPVNTSEHLAALGVFGLLQIVAFSEWVRGLLPSQQFKLVARAAVFVAVLLATIAIPAMERVGMIRGWTGRFYSLFDTGYVSLLLYHD